MGINQIGLFDYEKRVDKLKLIKNTTYVLNEKDKKLIQEMSDKICSQDRSFFTNNFKRDKSISLNEMNLNGFGAELAFCNLSNVLFDNSTIEKESHFSKVDAVLKNGKTIDVKNTIYTNGKLIVRLGKEQKVVDIYALMTGKFPNFKFCGWAKYEEIIQAKNIVNLGWGDAYALNQNQLNDELEIE